MTAPASPALRFAYGTNGLADLRLDDALGLLADLGYDGVGLTLDHMHLDPLAPDLARRTAAVARTLERRGLTVTVETGARYVLDRRRKHHPTLLDPDEAARAARVGLLRTAVRVAADLGAHAVHCFSGVTPPGTAPETAWQHLAQGIGTVLDDARAAGIALAVEPEPGQLLSDLAGFHRLRHALDDPPGLGVTLDIGHCQCLEPEPPAECVRASAPWIRHVQIEDMRRGTHEHLPFGEGEIDFPPVLEALRGTGYDGLVTVELPRHSHAGPDMAADSLRFLRAAESASRPPSPTTGPVPPPAPDGPVLPPARTSPAAPDGPRAPGVPGTAATPAAPPPAEPTARRASAAPDGSRAAVPDAAAPAERTGRAAAASAGPGAPPLWSTAAAPPSPTVPVTRARGAMPDPYGGSHRAE